MILPTTLSSYNSKESLLLEQLLKEHRNANCFNPSIIFFGNYIIIAFRAYQKSKRKPFHAYLLIFNKAENSLEVIDLSKYYLNHGIDKVADPKLTTLNDEVWLTFNTGHSKYPNNLYLAQVFPELNPPYTCQYSSRQRIEKNWSFFIEQDTLKALYSISPISILTAIEKNESKKSIYFALQYNNNPDHITDGLRKISIGTQAASRSNHLYLMAHEKKYFLGKRIYLGVPVHITKLNDHYAVTVSNKRFIHSWWSLLGSLTRHNQNLWSCTYFSGMQIRADNKVILAYGINDLRCAFKEIPFNNLWGSTLLLKK